MGIIKLNGISLCKITTHNRPTQHNDVSQTCKSLSIREIIAVVEKLKAEIKGPLIY